MGILATTMATVTSWLVLLLALSEIKFPSLSFLCTRGYYLICAAGRKWATATALTWPAHEGSRNARVPDCQSSAFTAQGKWEKKRELGSQHRIFFAIFPCAHLALGHDTQFSLLFAVKIIES